ncbi:stage III sporulation protein AE [Aceticella autotrophica]|uniref:Stage III sporulation protein AE n=1 Tax=Aceticella autotrophica TaxID=2755338 RepID=A0A974Y2P7_9THEO|nr:stage III sporulation protein AE [Aceticella autotrophica]QSZ26514.1 stage III sporulation protein AE [Aceticella autotrophica]
MRKSIILITILILLTVSIKVVYADDNLDIKSQIQGVDTHEIDSLLNGINDKNGNIMPVTNIKTYITNMLSGKQTFNIKDIFNNILNLFFKEISSSIKLLIQLIILAIISAVLTNIEGSFEREGISQIAFISIYAVLIIIAIKSFMGALTIGGDTINSMVDFMQAVLPMLITMLVSVGAMVSASFFQPAVILAVEFTAQIIRDFVFPAILFMTVIKIVSNISDKFSLNKLADFIKTVCTGSLSILLSIFLGIITIQGLTSSIADGVLSRTAKYAVGTFLPVIGGILSESIDAIIGASFLIKGAVGTFGLIAIIMISALPLIKLMVLLIIYKLSAALVEPIADKKIVAFLSDLSMSITYIFAALASVTLMMFLSITAVISAASVSVMMR